MVFWHIGSWVSVVESFEDRVVLSNIALVCILVAILTYLFWFKHLQRFLPFIDQESSNGFRAGKPSCICHFHWARVQWTIYCGGLVRRQGSRAHQWPWWRGSNGSRVEVAPRQWRFVSRGGVVHCHGQGLQPANLHCAHRGATTAICDVVARCCSDFTVCTVRVAHAVQFSGLILALECDAQNEMES